MGITHMELFLQNYSVSSMGLSIHLTQLTIDNAAFHCSKNILGQHLFGGCGPFSEQAGPMHVFAWANVLTRSLSITDNWVVLHAMLDTQEKVRWKKYVV